MQIFRVDNIVFAKKVFLCCFAKCNQDYLELKIHLKKVSMKPGRGSQVLFTLQ